MNIKQTVKVLFVSTVLVAGFVSVFAGTPAMAQERCGGIDTAIISCEQGGTGGIENTGLWGVLLLAINILTGLVGVAALAGIVYGSVLYASAGGSSDQTKKAMEIITNTVVGVIAFALMFAFLNFIIPGGVFN